MYGESEHPHRQPMEDNDPSRLPFWEVAALGPRSRISLSDFSKLTVLIETWWRRRSFHIPTGQNPSLKLSCPWLWFMPASFLD